MSEKFRVRLFRKASRLFWFLTEPGTLSVYLKGYDPDLFMVLKRSKLLDNLSINTVIDIGAEKGKWSYVVHLVRPQADIFCFEPLEEHIEEIDKHSFIKKVFPFALGDVNGETEFYITGGTHSSSLLNPSVQAINFFGKALELQEVRRISVRRLDDILQVEELQREFLVKMDVQGAEKKVIQGGKQIIGSACALIIEISFINLYNGQSSFQELFDLLSELNFVYKGALIDYRSDDGLVLFEDALFLREDNK